MIPRSLHQEYTLLPWQLANNPWDDTLGPFKYSAPHSLSSHGFSTHWLFLSGTFFQMVSQMVSFLNSLIRSAFISWYSSLITKFPWTWDKLYFLLRRLSKCLLFTLSLQSSEWRMVLLSLPRWKIRSLSLSLSLPLSLVQYGLLAFVVNVNIRDLKVSLLSLFQVILYKKDWWLFRL